MRSMLYLTASALNGVPSWNVTPWRRCSVHTRPSADTSYDSAKCGTISPGRRQLQQRLDDVLRHRGRRGVRDVVRIQRHRIRPGHDDQLALGEYTDRQRRKLPN